MSLESDNLRFKAVYDYNAQRSDELTFKVNDIIENVIIHSGGWAFGKIGPKSGLFPLNHATELIYVKRDEENQSCTKEVYRAIYSYLPSHEDEIELVAGSNVEVIHKDPSGWWQGRRLGKEGIFPSNFVTGPIVDATIPRHSPIVEDSPVVLRRSSNSTGKVKSFHASIDQNIGATPTSTMFDPEDEPLGPMFGSLTSQFDWSTASLSSYKAKPGFFGRIKHSLSTKSLFPKFLSGRLSSNSLNDKVSIGSSSFRRRRNSLASFFHQSSSKLPSHSSSNASDKSGFLPGYRQCSTPVSKLDEKARKFSLSTESKRSVRDPEQCTSWVFKESTPSQSCFQSRFGSHEDSGVRDMDIDSPEDIFGPIIEMNDEVFDDMFEKKEEKNGNKSTPSKESTTFTTFRPSETSRLSLSKLRTSFSPFEKRFSLGSSSRTPIKTNPKSYMEAEGWTSKESRSHGALD